MSGEKILALAGYFTDEAVIAHEAEVAADTCGELFVGLAFSPRRSMEFLTKMFIGNAGNGVERVGERLEKFPVFADDIQGADSAVVLDTGPRDFIQNIPDRPVIFESGHLLHEAVIDIVGHLGTDGDVGNAFAQGQAFFGTDAPTAFGAAENAEHGGIVHGHFDAQIVLFVVKFDRVLIDPVAYANAIVPKAGARKDFRIGQGMRLSGGVHGTPHVAQDPITGSGHEGVAQKSIHNRIQGVWRIKHIIGGPFALPQSPVIGEAWAEGYGHGRKSPGQETDEQGLPAGVELGVKELLGTGVVGDMKEFIAVQYERDSVSGERPAQPFSSVKRDLNIVGEPGLESDAHEAIVGVVVVKIQVFATGKFAAQLRESGLGVIVGAISGTSLGAGPNADQAVCDLQVVLPLVGDGFLAFVTRRDGNNSPPALRKGISIGLLYEHLGLGHDPFFVVLVEDAARAEKRHGAVGEHKGAQAAFENDTVEAADNALDFTAESLYKRIHAPSSCDGFFSCTHNIRDQRRISTTFRTGNIWENSVGSWNTSDTWDYQPTLISAPAMQSCGEFGSPTVSVGVRKNKASLGRLRVRRAKHWTPFHASAGNLQAA
jgi:hypothetical protein